MESLIGLLGWYSAGLPIGKPYLMSLYANTARYGQNTRRITLSQECIADLDFWRAIIVATYDNPSLLGASIDAMRANKTPTIFLRTDASSLVGGGAILSESRGGEDTWHLPDAAIRWTISERKSFEDMNISINVLEYFTATYYILLWAPHLKGQTIWMECDNTAAVSWLLRSRTKGNPAADAIARVFSLFCLLENIDYTCTHLSGEHNVIADFRSRDLLYHAQEADEMTDGSQSTDMSRRGICRKLLHLCVTKPETMHGQELVNVLTSLLISPGKPTAKWPN
jgi:hypothetical protein